MQSICSITLRGKINEKYEEFFNKMFRFRENLILIIYKHAISAISTETNFSRSIFKVYFPENDDLKRNFSLIFVRKISSCQSFGAELAKVYQRNFQTRRKNKKYFVLSFRLIFTYKFTYFRLVENHHIDDTLYIIWLLLELGGKKEIKISIPVVYFLLYSFDYHLG